MLNMAVDHLLVTLILGMVALLLPIPVMILGTLVVIVQVMVFCLLTSIYITLATEHEEHARPTTRATARATPRPPRTDSNGFATQPGSAQSRPAREL